jgi:ubiquinone/menaquinone biosynthesis C-methylase UbiE
LQEVRVNRHFHWDELLEGRAVEEFLSADDLWGENQDVDNLGRTLWRQYLTDRIGRTRSLRLLEIGFGSGIDYRGLESAGLLDTPELSYFGVDVTRKFVAHARRRFSKMTPFLIDGYHLPFRNGCFDVVYMRHVLEHQTHYRFLLSEALRVCRGQVFLIFFLPLRDAEEDTIEFDGTWYNNHYSRLRFTEFVRERGYETREVASFRYEAGYSRDSLLVLYRPKNKEPTATATVDSALTG